MLPNPDEMMMDHKNHILYIKYDDSNIISAIDMLSPDLKQTKIKLSHDPGAMAVDDKGLLYFTAGNDLSTRVPK